MEKILKNSFCQLSKPQRNTFCLPITIDFAQSNWVKIEKKELEIMMRLLGASSWITHIYYLQHAQCTLCTVYSVQIVCLFSPYHISYVIFHPHPRSTIRTMFSHLFAFFLVPLSMFLCFEFLFRFFLSLPVAFD